MSVLLAGVILMNGALAAGDASAGAPIAEDAPIAGDAPMLMGDTRRFGKVLLDQLEWRHSGSQDAAAWEAEGWYGGDRDKVWARTEGERAGPDTREARGELFWDRAIGPWWNLQAGGREDFGGGPPRTWAAVGLTGLAPYWLELEATLYLGDAGRTAARLKAEYDILLTQRLILQPEAEANLYGKRDPPRRLDSGLSELELGLRLRYEIRREIAPYLGVSWTREAELVSMPGGGRPIVSRQAQLVVGVRAWF